MTGPAVHEKAEDVRRFGLTASAVMTVASLASCGGGGHTATAGAPTPTPSDTSASASPPGHRDETADKSLDQVENDLRFATQPHGDLYLQERRKGFCVVQGTVPTPQVLDSTALEEIVKRMQTRGWTPDGPVESFDTQTASSMSMAYVESGKYRVLLGTAPVAPEVEEAYAPNQGTIAISADWPCRNN